MGAVFVADYAGASGFRKRVALKMLRSDRASEQLADSLRREARTAVRLEHPYIAQVYDLSERDSDPFVVMEYVHGESLATLADRAGSLPYELVSWIGVAIADALSYAHDDRGATGSGVVHRDLSPQNILISYDGVPKLVDFGIALHHGQPDGVGAVRGRQAYMPPEQRRGEPVDGRADIYGLGMVLYQLAAGAHPWSVAGHEVERPPDPRGLRPDFPEALWRAISRATEPKREARPGTARELLAMLRRGIDDTGGFDQRDDLARTMTELFGERRREKDRILASEIGLDSETEAVPDPDPTPTGRNESGSGEIPKRRHTLPWAAAAVVVVLGGLAAARTMWPQDRPAGSAVGSSTGAVVPLTCVLVDPPDSAANNEATWAAARLIGIGLERAGLRPVHGYRSQDERGWTDDGLAEALTACRRAGTQQYLYVRGEATGAVTLRVGTADSPAKRSREPTLVASARSGLADLGVSLPDGPLTRELTSRLDDRAAIMVLTAREDLVLERPTAAGRDAIAALAREHPALDSGSTARLILLWWAGDLDEEPAPPLPDDASDRVRVLRDVIIALAQREPLRASQLVVPILEDRRYRDDALALYLAGEAYVHQGRPAEGVVYLSRSLARDPQLGPAIYHVFERRLAEGDTEGVLEVATLWERIEPSGLHAAEYRAYAALGGGDEAAAIAAFEDLLRRARNPSRRDNGAHSGLMHSLLLAGRADDALGYAGGLRPALVGPVPVSKVMVEPIAYAIGLDRRDPDLVADWGEVTRSRLADDAGVPNHWLLRYTMALLDTLAGRDDGRERWVPTPPPPGVPRSYRFAAQRLLLAALEGRGAAPALHGVEPAARRLAEALELERAGDLERAAEALHAAIASSSSGEFDCIAAAALARIERRREHHARATAACERVLRPRVPRAYCIALRSQCASSEAVATP
jgi:tRNA A-37 threonylcarbamoyl transferase component Bud32